MFKKICLKILDSKAVNYFIMHILPYVRLSVGYTKLKGLHYNLAYKMLQPGDIILAIDEKKVATMIIPGEWSHAEVCISKDGSFETVGMTHENYTKATFYDVCKQSDRIAVLRMKEYDINYIHNFIHNVKKLEGAVYDTGFTFGIKALYCSELVYAADNNNMFKIDTSDLCGLGRSYVSPSDLYTAKGLTVVFDSNWVSRP